MGIQEKFDGYCDPAVGLLLLCEKKISKPCLAAPACDPFG